MKTFGRGVYMRDKFTRGMVAGILAGIPVVAVNQTSYFLKLSSLRYLDFASAMIFGSLPKTRGEAWFTFFVLWGFFGVLGAVFALLVPVIKSEKLVLKSVTFGGMVWFLTYAITALYKVPELRQIPLNNAISNFIGATVWGFALGFAFSWLGDKQTEGKKRVFRIAPELARKPVKQVVHPVKPKKIK